MKKRITKRSILAAAALVLCLSVTIGSAMAYFTDYEDAQGGAVLHLGGETEIDEGSDARNKHIVIQNTGETNMMVRVGIFGNENEKYLTVTPAAGWIAGSDGFYDYGSTLKPEEQTSAIDAVLKAEWTKGGENPDLKDFEITVVHESAQAIFDDATQKLAIPAGWDKATAGKIAPAAHPQDEEVSAS